MARAHRQQRASHGFPTSISDDFKVPLMFPERQNNYGTDNGKETDFRAPKNSDFRAVLAVLLAAVGSLCYGYAIGFSSPALPDLYNEEGPLHLSKRQGAFFASLVTLGAIIGCPIGGALSDLCGRKLTILFSAIPFEAGWLILRLADNITMLDGGRLLTGIGCGMIAVSYPVYIAEISPPNLRGSLGVIHQTSITAGILLSYGIGAINLWRNTTMPGIIMPALLVPIMLLLTDTPRWYLQHNKRSKALKTLAWLRGDSSDIQYECYETEKTIDMHGHLSVKEFFKASVIKPLVIGVGLMIFQQTSGCIVIIMNCSSIFTSAGFTDSKVVSLSTAGVQLLINILASGIIYKVGRRSLLISMAIIMAICHFGIGTFFHFTSEKLCNSTSFESSPSHSIPACELSWLAITCIITFYIAFSLAWGPVPWIIMAEIFPLRARSISGSIAAISAFGSAFILLWCYPYMHQAMTEAGVYWFYGSFCVLSSLFVYCIVPETRGQTLEQIENNFEPSRNYPAIE